MSVCVYAWISASTRSILTEQVSFFLFFFLCNGGSKIRFLIGPMCFCFISIFDFLKIYFCFFLMIGSRYLNRMGSIQKRIKIPIFSKKKILAITVLLLLTKTCFFFFFLKLITPKLNGQFFEKNNDNAEYK